MAIITKRPTPTPGLDCAMLPEDWPFDSDVEAICEAADMVVLHACGLRLLSRKDPSDSLGIERAYLREGWRDEAGLGFSASLSDCPIPAVVPDDELSSSVSDEVGAIVSGACRLEALVTDFDDEVSRFLDDYYLRGGWMRWLAGEPRGEEWRDWAVRPRITSAAR